MKIIEMLLSKELHITREFPQIWQYDSGNYYRGQVNLFNDFSKYAEMLYGDLLSIKQFYEHDFNQISDIGVDEALNLFDELFNQLVSTAFLVDRFKKDYSNSVEALGGWNKEGRFAILTHYTYIKKGIVTNFGENKKFTDSAYNKLNFLTHGIFALEEHLSQFTKRIWQDKITKVENYDKTKPYGLLVKRLLNWRTDIDTQEKQEYMKERLATSTSFIYHKKTKLFKEVEHKWQIIMGLVYDLQDGFICGRNEDAFLEESIDGHNPLYTMPYGSVHKVYDQNNHKVFAMGTKIALPKGLIIKYSDCTNEVVLDQTKAKPCAVFYVNQSDRNLGMNQQQSIAEAGQLAKELNLPLLEIDCKNEFFSNKELDI